MNKDLILTSNVLDIIFDGRNKDYGAYILRKDYNGRMRMALLAMAIISIMFCLTALTKNHNNLLMDAHKIINPDGGKLSPYITAKIGLPKPIKATQKKHFVDPLAPPRIVHSNNINKLPATAELMQQSINGNSSAIDVPAEISNESGNGKGFQEISTAPVIAKKEHPAAVEVADVMPEYPGGIKALLEFLKKNIHEPDNAEEDEEVSVRVKFIVNYDGKLEGFNVVQSGGDPYDNEVVRVLKKMPKWVPGKSNGENVSVYFVVPVRFVKQD